MCTADVVTKNRPMKVESATKLGLESRAALLFAAATKSLGVGERHGWSNDVLCQGRMEEFGARYHNTLKRQCL